MGETVRFASNGSEAEGYLALPAVGSAGSPRGGVVVIQEWWGLVPHVQDLAERFAGQGFVALAPDLYHGEKTSEPDEAGKLMMGLAVPRAAKDIAGAATYLAARPETGGKLGVVGFCMGGTLALWAPTLADEIVAAVGFYPAPFRHWNELDPSWSKYAGKSAMIHAAEGDGGTGADNVAAARTAIEQAGGTVSAFDYPGTEHAFFNDTRPEVYHADASGQAWERTLGLFRERLG
jgi:carboxymethylenebutenolidase